MLANAAQKIEASEKRYSSEQLRKIAKFEPHPNRLVPRRKTKQTINISVPQGRKKTETSSTGGYTQGLC